MTLEAERPASISPRGLSALLRYLFCGGLAGLLAGILFLGAGSRVVMRISALLDPAARGTLTENDNVIGAITLEGTIELVIFEGIFGGLMAGLLWVLVREWLPSKTWQRVSLGGLVAAILGSFLVVSAENRDFAALDPAAANAGMFIAIVGLTGCGAAALDRHLERLLPRSGRAAVLLGGLAVLGGLLAVPLVGQAFLAEDFCGCENPPRLAAPFLALAGVASVLSWRRWFKLSDGTAKVPWLRALGIAGIVGACAFAAVDLIGELRDIV